MDTKKIADIYKKANLSDADQFGMVRLKCIENQIKSVTEIAEVYEAVRQHQIESGVWGYEDYTEAGSNSSGRVYRAGNSSLNKNCVIWSINHYLGLNRRPEVIDAVCDAARHFGSGSGTSGLSGGHCMLHKKLEDRLAKIFKKEDAILFSTGFTANLGAISALGRNGNNLMLLDRECHASMFDGVKLSGCKYMVFKHNDIEDLKKKLSENVGRYDNVFVVVESVYSMSGEEAPLEKIVALKNNYNFYLYVDEAHAFGFYDIGGLCSKLGISEQVDFIMTTLSKSLASVGGVVACRRDFKTFIVGEAMSYIFQAAMPPADAAAALVSLDIIEKEPEIVQSLWKKTEYFRHLLENSGFNVGKGSSPIVALYINDVDTLLKFSKQLFERGIYTTAITYPAVAPNEVRFRFIVNESHSYEQIDYTFNVLVEIGINLGVISTPHTKG